MFSNFEAALQQLTHVFLLTLTDTLIDMSYFNAALLLSYMLYSETESHKPQWLPLVIVIITSAALFFNLVLFYESTHLTYSAASFRLVRLNNLTITKLESSLILVSLFVTPVSWLLTEKKNKKSSAKITICYLLLLFLITALCLSKSIIGFFFFYEMFLLISFIIVLTSSFNKRSRSTSFYFLAWTQLGSLMVMLGVIILTHQQRCTDFYGIRLLNDQSSAAALVASIALFLGFGIKLPLWPFHFWITKTHVEANSGFSTLLSGILVKIAVLGYFKFKSAIFINTSLNLIFLSAVVYSMIDSSLKLCSQTDLKKIVAYATIFEMNFLALGFFFPSNQSINVVSVFVVFHSLISTLFFFIVDCLYKKYNTRVVSSISSLQEDCLKLSVLLCVSLLLFTGLPLTIKFCIEIFVISQLWCWCPPIAVAVLVSTYIFNFFFLKFFMGTLFGFKKNSTAITNTSKKDIIVMSLILSSIFFLTF